MMVILVVCIGIFLALSTFLVVRRAEIQKLKTEVRLHAHQHINLLDKEINIGLEALQSLSSFFKSSEVVTREEFRSFTKDILQRNHSFQAIEWIPRIQRSLREEYERDARMDGFKDFQITERQTQGKMIRAGERDEYFPAYFVEPYKGNEIALGYNLASNPVRKAALEKARDTGQMVASARITLVQETGHQYGLLVFLPLYQKEALTDTVEARRKNLIGFVLGVYRVDVIVDNAFKLLEGFNGYIYDMSSPRGENFLYAYPKQAETNSNQIKHENKFAISQQLNFADRQWEVICDFVPHFLSYLQTAASFGILLGGLLFTCLLAAYLTTHIRRTAQIEELADKLSIEVVERKQSGEALRESEEKYRLLMNNLPGFVYKGFKDWFIEFYDNRIEMLTGYNMHTFNSGEMKWVDLIIPEEIQPAKQAFVQALKTDKPYVRDYRIKTKAGNIIWVQERGSIVCNDDGDIEYVSGIFFDVTERKQLEAQLLQAHKMEAVGVLAGGVAHDFNNILTVIIGNAGFALMEIAKDDSLRELIEEIRDAGERGGALTRQLLAFSRKQMIQPKIVGLNHLLTGIEKMLSRLISEDIEVLMILDPALWEIEIDPGQMEQMIINLAINARDAMPKGGKLTIETANVDLDKDDFSARGVEERPGAYVMLAVSDTGCGVDKEIQEHIFEPFFTTKETGKGTGLGLSTVYGIVKQNNGFIWVDSEPGQGSSFKVYLPKAKKDVVSVKKEQPPATELGGSETILIVEDDDHLRKFAKTALQQKGYQVLEAKNGEDALKISQDHQGPIDLLIADVVMPKMSGKETAERLQPLHSQMKVIYMSGYTDDAIVHHGVLAPGLNFLEKPFTSQDLARKVRGVLDN